MIFALFGGLLAIGFAARSAGADDSSLSSKPADQAAATQYFKVQVLHPAKVGDRLHMKREIEQSVNEVSETNNQPGGTQNATNEINFSGTLEVLAVDKRGEPVRWKVSGGVAGMKGTSGSGHETLLKPGTDFVVSFSGGHAVVADSDEHHPLSDDAKKLLPYVFGATGGRGDASLDDILDNSTAPRSAKWNVNAKAVAAALQGFDSKLKLSDISGTARIKAVVGEGSKQVLTVEYEFKADSKKPNNPTNGTTPVAATLTETGIISVPADGSTGYFSGKMQIHSNSTFKKTTNKKETSRVGYKTVTKNVPVTEKAVIDRIEKISTLITYGDEEKKESPATATPSPSASASPGSAAPSSTSASAGASSGS